MTQDGETGFLTQVTLGLLESLILILLLGEEVLPQQGRWDPAFYMGQQVVYAASWTCLLTVTLSSLITKPFWVYFLCLDIFFPNSNFPLSQMGCVLLGRRYRITLWRNLRKLNSECAQFSDPFSSRCSSCLMTPKIHPSFFLAGPRLS